MQKQLNQNFLGIPAEILLMNMLSRFRRSNWRWAHSNCGILPTEEPPAQLKLT
jgi:hypothetical protein